MALNFPDSPTNGQKYTDATTAETWTYELATNSWTSDGLTTSSGVQYKGDLDFTQPPPTGLSAGWQYSSSVSGTPNAGFTGLTGPIAKGDVALYTGSGWTVLSHTISDATTTAKGIVQLADATAVTAGTVGRVVDAKELKDGLTFLQDGTNARPRTVLSKLKDVVSVKDFGAVGDGRADDTAAIQAAIDYAKIAAKNVYIPAGTYIITGAGLTYRSDSNGGVLISGTSSGDANANTGSVLKYTGTQSCFTFSGKAVYSSLQNITFLGVDGQGAIGVNIDNAWFIDIRQCVFKYFKSASSGAGIKIGWVTGGFAGVTTIQDCRISECYAGVIVEGQDINVINIQSCVITDNTIGFRHGRNTAVPVSSRAVNFNNTLFEANADHDIYSYGGAQGWNITGCYFEQNDALKNLSRIHLANTLSPRNCAINITGNVFSKQLHATNQQLVYVWDPDGLIFKNNWSAYGDLTTGWSVYVAGGGTNTELWPMSVPVADKPYPINDNSVLLPTGSVYKTSGDLSLTTGIRFPATQPGSSNPNTLDDYEEGVWTPRNNYVTLVNNKGATYRKIGSFVYASFDVTFPVNAQGNAAEIAGLPFPSDAGSASECVHITYSDYGNVLYSRNFYQTTSQFYDSSGVTLTNASLSGKKVIGMFVYHTPA